MLSSVWIVKSYLLSPAAISGAATAFSLPAVTLGYLAANLGARGALAAQGITRATVSSRNSSKGTRGRGGSYLPSPGEIFGGGRGRSTSSKPSPTTGGGTGGSTARSTGRGQDNPLSSPATPSLRKPYRMRSIIEHSGRLDKQSLPSNISAISRVGKKHKIK